MAGALVRALRRLGRDVIRAVDVHPIFRLLTALSALMQGLVQGDASPSQSP